MRVELLKTFKVAKDDEPKKTEAIPAGKILDESKGDHIPQDIKTAVGKGNKNIRVLHDGNVALVEEAAEGIEKLSTELQAARDTIESLNAEIGTLSARNQVLEIETQDLKKKYEIGDATTETYESTGKCGPFTIESKEPIPVKGSKK